MLLPAETQLDLNPDWFAPTAPAGAEEIVAFMLTAQGDGFWYVATPYTRYPGGHENAFIDASIAGAWLVERGVHVFVPITHSHPIATRGGLPEELNTLRVWMDQDGPFMAAAVGLCIVQMPGWDSSAGIAEEFKHFSRAGKPVVQLRWPLEQ